MILLGGRVEKKDIDEMRLLEDNHKCANRSLIVRRKLERLKIRGFNESISK